MTATASRKGKVLVPGGSVWYRIAGDGDGTPLLTLHGGPGMTHDSIDSLADLSGDRPVVFYDQLGSGKSDRPADVSLWRIGRFVEEVAAVRAELGFDQVHLLGQSWGTTLAVEYMLGRPQGVVSLTLASPCLSIPRFAEDCVRLRAALPDDVRATLDIHESAGTTAAPEYAAAVMEFYKRYICRIWPWPDSLVRTLTGANMDVYHTMWGPNDFTPTGNLSDYDATPRLREIDVPVLFTCGRYDECTPEATAAFARAIPGAEVAVFDDSAHMAHMEEREAFMARLSGFLHRAEHAG
jgi:proline iminopeptidase